MTIPAMGRMQPARFAGFHTPSRVRLAQLLAQDKTGAGVPTVLITQVFNGRSKKPVKETTKTVRIIQLEGHQGRTVNGMRVPTLPNSAYNHDEVDLVTIRHADTGKTETFLTGFYMVPSETETWTINFDRVTPQGQPVETHVSMTLSDRAFDRAQERQEYAQPHTYRLLIDNMADFLQNAGERPPVIGDIATLIQGALKNRRP